MTPDDHQRDALQTESIPDDLLTNAGQADALKAMLRAAVHYGRFADKLKKHLFYKREMDINAIVEHLDIGRFDGLWGSAEFPNSDLDFDKINLDRRKVRLLHAFLGIFSELEEMAGPLFKHVFEGETLDEVNMSEEGGDIDWYVAIWQGALGFLRSVAMKRNIAKLAKRYPGNVFTTQRAVERDLDAERDILEGAEDTKLEKLRQWANSTEHGFAASEVLAILDGR
jgi:hypothetical protein